jgi:hypothetical protein
MTEATKNLLSKLPSTFTAIDAARVWECPLTTSKARLFLLKKERAIDVHEAGKKTGYGSTQNVYVKKK